MFQMCSNVYNYYKMNTEPSFIIRTNIAQCAQALALSKNDVFEINCQICIKCLPNDHI